MAKKLDQAKDLVDEVMSFLQEKVDNAGESDASQEKAQALSDIVDKLDTISTDLDDARAELEGVS